MPPNPVCFGPGCGRAVGSNEVYCFECFDVLPAHLREAVEANTPAIRQPAPPVKCQTLVNTCAAFLQREDRFWVADAKNPWCGGVVWVNREWPAERRDAHPLANPVALTQKSSRADKLRAFLAYEDYLDALPNRDELLMDLYHQTRCGFIPLGCACGLWLPGMGRLTCHAWVLAQRLNRLHHTGEI